VVRDGLESEVAVEGGGMGCEIGSRAAESGVLPGLLEAEVWGGLTGEGEVV
jgi:hypothetical protein